MNNVGLNNAYNEVRTFHKSFYHPIEDKPTSISIERANRRYSWMLEEINEFLEAANNNDIVEQADAMIDVIYFALGTLVEMGVKPQPLFEIVQKANMSKLWKDGNPHYKVDGKVMKPSTWVDPHPLLQKEIEKQLNAQ